MAQLKFKDWETTTNGELPEIGTIAPDFELVKMDLSTVKLSDYRSKNVILNVFISLDTGTCASTMRRFNEEATRLSNTAILCISRDLPFAMKRFCGAEGIENVEPLSDFRNGDFAKAYGLQYINSPLKTLCSRAVLVLDEEGKVVYTEHVADGSTEPNYDKALDALATLI